MKILLISPPAYPLFYGGRLIAFHLGGELQRRGHAVDLLAYSDQPGDRADLHHYESAFRDVELLNEGGRRARLSFLTRLARPGSRWPRRAAESWSPELWRAIERRLRAEHYDVAHVIGGAYVYDVFEAFRGLPAVITPCDSFALLARRTLEREGSGAVEKLKARARWLTARAWERWMYTPYRRTVVVSDVDRDELLAGNAELKVDVIPNGVDVDSFQPPAAARGASSLLFVGNFRYPPNADAALHLATEIFPRVRAQVPEAKLWLVGNGPPESLAALASDAITVTGRVPDVRPYLAQSAAFVSPLRLGAGMKNKVLEALAMGCPLVATPLSVDGIAVTDGVDAVVTSDDDFAQATVRVLQDADLQRRLSANGPALIREHYSWTRVAELYEALYRDVQGP